MRPRNYRIISARSFLIFPEESAADYSAFVPAGDILPPVTFTRLHSSAQVRLMTHDSWRPDVNTRLVSVSTLGKLLVYVHGPRLDALRFSGLQQID